MVATLWQYKQGHRIVGVTMPLYSSGTLAGNENGFSSNEPDCKMGAEVETLPKSEEKMPWHYLFVHHMKMDSVNKELEKAFPTFIHRSVIYKKEHKQVRKDERPTISGLLFVKGNSLDIEKYLKESIPGLHLVKDCCTGRIASIEDGVMQSFMKVSQMDSTLIRFMAHPFSHYADGNVLVRITSGALAGMEGYRIRISRNKCLVTSIGGMTVAIGGIHKESFENLDEYVKQRREQLHIGKDGADMVLSPVQVQIDACLFVPQSQLDVIAIAHALEPWAEKVLALVKAGDADNAVETALFMLEEIGSHFQCTGQNPEIEDLKDILALSQKLESALASIQSHPDVSADLKETIASERESLALRFPILGVEV